MQYNKVILSGRLVKVDERDSGASMIWVETGNREEKSVKGAAVPTFFTPVVPVRVPSYVQSKLNEGFYEPGMDILVEGRLQGVKRIVDEKDFYVVEVQASRVYKERNGSEAEDEEYGE